MLELGLRVRGKRVVGLLVTGVLVFGRVPIARMLMLNRGLLITILTAHGHDRRVQILQGQTADEQ